MKESKSENISENVVCWLCNSYLIDAVSLSECMHSYCRSCLLQSLDKGGGTFRCLKCDRPIARDLSEAFARDNTIQNLVYKSAPDVFWQELKQRGEYLKKRAVPSDEKALILDKKLVQLASELCAPNEVVSLCLEYISPGLPDNEEEESEVKEAKQVDENKPSTVADADRWEKQEAQMTSFRRYFRCLASTKISALRKLLEAKLEVSDTYRLLFVDPQCNATLEDQCTLQDVAYMFRWHRDGPMKIFFTLQRHFEEEKPPVLDMEFMPELVAEEETLSQTNSTAVTTAIENAVQLPTLTVSLNTSMMEGGPNHQPIITTEVHPPPRKKRKPASPTKKQHVAFSTPVQRMTGISPLAKGPPPLARLENSSPCKKSGGSCSRTKPVEKSFKRPFENVPPPKLAKLSPTTFDNKLQQIIESSPNCSSKTTHKGNRMKSVSRALEQTAKPDESEESPHPSSNDNFKKESAIGNMEETKQASSDGAKSVGNGDVKSELCQPKEQTGSSAVKERAPNKSYSISKFASSTWDAPEAASSTNVSTTDTSAAAAISHPRPIQPRPVEMKASYETLMKNYGLSGIGSKLPPFPLDGKHVGFNPAMHMQSPFFMDPKIASQPIKHLLSGRGMPFMPETPPYLRNPALSNLMHHIHMQRSPASSITGASTSALLSHSNGSTTSSSSAPTDQLIPTSVTQNPLTNTTSLKGAQLKLPVIPLPATPSAAESSSKLLNSGNSRTASPTTKLQPKIVSPLPIPTAHITPFMSHS